MFGRAILAALTGALMMGSTARAETLAVGPGQTFDAPCAAVAAAAPNDVIEIASGVYTDSCVIGVAGLTLRGVADQPKIDLSGTDHPAQYKGIYVVTAADVTIENLELTGAHISDDNGANAAAIRIEAPGLTVRHCNIHDNQNGILGGTTGTVTIEFTEFAGNGRGDGCNQGGCTHNLYIAAIDELQFRFNWSHRVATDTMDKGHLLKSRAKRNFILYNRLSGEDGFDSYEVDAPNGGLLVLVGNVIQKGKQAGNSNLLAWGEEGASNPDKRVFLVHNTFVNDYGSGRFLNLTGATLTAHNNIFAGAGSVGTSGAPSEDNWVGSDPGFKDAAHFDYHLGDSSVMGKAVDPGMADAFDLTPDSEYLHPVGQTARPSTRDSGAFESGSAARPAPAAGSGGAGGARGAGSGGAATGQAGSNASGGSGGSPGARAGSNAAGSAGHAGSGSTDAGPESTDESSDGCSCTLVGGTSRAVPRATWFAIGALAVFSRCVRRRHRPRNGARARSELAS
jgi:hypothetical protein